MNQSSPHLTAIDANLRIGPNKSYGDEGEGGELVCYDCGMVKGPSFQGEVPHYLVVTHHTYKRIFYFNERCARWTCTEPSIPQDIWDVIKEESKRDVYGPITKFGRGTVSKILRNVSLPKKVIKKHQSKKFKCNPMSKKRFYDKFFEKWKTICERLGKKVEIPSMQLVMLIKELFMHTLTPFELNRHSPQCTGKIHNCTKYFGCLQNFLNYDFVFRKLLQVAEIKFGYKDCYNKFKNDFSLVSAKIRDTKLRPIFKKICEYNQWPCPDFE